LVRTLVFGIAPHALAEGGTRQIVGRPGRLPRRQKISTRLAQRTRQENLSSGAFAA
jgi:hypothetical protein